MPQSTEKMMEAAVEETRAAVPDSCDPTEVVGRMRNLSVELRPSSIDDLVGADEIKSQILEMLRQGRLPSALLFSGNPGSGKTTIARILARMIQRNPQDEFDISETNGADCNTVDDARSLVERARYGPMTGDYKVFILDEAQRMTAAAQQIMLKGVEEPHPKMVWMFCTSAPSKLDPALRRRCVQYTMRALTDEEVGILVCQCLKKIGGDIETQFLQTSKYQELIDALIANRVLTPGHIVMALDKFISGASATEAASVTQVTSVDALAVTRETVQGNWIAVQKLLLHAAPEDGRGIRACVTGYFKSVLVKAETRARAEMAAWAIHELTSHATFEDSLQLSATAASLFFICDKINDMRGK